MPTCPECGKEINELIYTEEQSWFVTIDWFGRLYFEPIYDEEKGYPPDGEYRCPKCGEVLFTKGSDAEVFLKKGIPGIVMKRLSGD